MPLSRFLEARISLPPSCSESSAFRISLNVGIFRAGRIEYWPIRDLNFPF
jgi:hypothetical protein